MRREFGCTYVIVGHSERHSAHFESDEMIALKAQAALRANLIPLVCVGATAFDREAGFTKPVVERQLRAVVDRLTSTERSRCVVAYEPIWGIGTGMSVAPEQAADTHMWIRQCFSQDDPERADTTRVLYGGSVEPSNAHELFSQPGIDGALVSDGSLVAEAFLSIAASLHFD